MDPNPYPGVAHPIGIDVVWTEGIRLIDGQLRQAGDLDSKTNVLIGFVSGILALVVAQPQELGVFAWIFVTELLAALGQLLWSVRLRNFGNAPALPRLAEWADIEPGAIRAAFVPNLIEAYETNEDSLAAKARYLRLALYAIAVFGVTAAGVILIPRGT